MAGAKRLAAEGLDLLDVGVALFDRESRLVHANAAFRRLRDYPDDVCRPGATLESLLRFNADRGDFGPGDPANHVAERLAEITQAENREIEREMADGQILAIRYRRTGGGGLLVTFEDRTDQRRAETALRANEERHRLVTRATSDGIYDWNVTDDVLYVSDNLTRLLDFDLDAKASGMWVERVHPDDYAGYADAIRQHFKGQTDALEHEYRVRSASGDYRLIQDRGIGMRDTAGKVVRMVGAVRDITEIRAAEAERDRTEARLLSSLATISDGILLVDPENRVQLWNDRYYQIFAEAVGGADLSQVITQGRPFAEMIRDGYDLGMFKPHPDGVDHWVAERMKAWNQPASQWELELANGSWILLNERQMPDGGRVSVYTDISELKRREQDAQAARQRFEEAIEAISSGFALFDPEDRLVIWNSRFRDYFSEMADVFVPGTPFRDMLSASIERGLFPAVQGNDAEFLEGILAERARGIGKIRENRLSGGMWLQIQDHRTKDGGLVSIYTDVTELKTSEQEAHAAKERFEEAIEAISSGFALWDKDDCLLVSNSRYRAYFAEISDLVVPGITFREVMGEVIRRGIVTGLDADAEITLENVIAKRNATTGAPREQLHANGNWLQITDHRTAEGGIVSIYTDVTTLKTREAETAKARDEAEAALADLQKAQERLIQAEKMASLGQLTAGIAHEIKNPLNFVNNFAKLSDEMLAELSEILDEPIKAMDHETRDDVEDLLATVRENLSKINEHGQRADSIVKNMLLHSREGPSERQMANVNAIAEEALNLAYHGARAENPNFNIEMVRDMDPGLGKIDCFPQDLMRVFLNLIGNGMYAAHKRAGAESDGFKPAITLSSRALDGAVEVVVRDNGAGIPPDVREKIFEPFFTTKPAGEGTGLGLSLSYDIVVKRHGGELSVDSKPGSHTDFRVVLPGAMPAGSGKLS